MIKDSGARREFESGAVRDMAEGKGRCDLLPLDIVCDLFDFIGIEINIIRLLSQFQDTGSEKYLYEALNYFTANEYGSYGEMLLSVAKQYEEGAKKYNDNNWKNGIPTSVYLDSAIRHYLKFSAGFEDEPHDRAFCWNLFGCLWTIKHKPELHNVGVEIDLDDSKLH